MTDNPILKIAWAAGFFDGEGHISWGSPGPGSKTFKCGYGTPRLMVGQTHKEPLSRFLDAVGGGNITGPYSRGPTRRPMWSYQAYGETAIKIFQLLAPYLSDVKLHDGNAALTTWLGRQARKTSKFGRLLKEAA
jgi:hypothetical protein